MADAAVRPPDCEPELDNCGTMIAPIFIMSFAILLGQIILNLFTTIVIETFEELDEVQQLFHVHRAWNVLISLSQEISLHACACV